MLQHNFLCIESMSNRGFAYIICFFLVLGSVRGQSNASYVKVQSIHISGNYHTKPWIIQYEIPFKEGDALSIDEIPELTRKTRENLINMRLFSKVSIQNEREGQYIRFQIEVRELWYLYPGLIFELADRNINTWWQEQNHSLSRVNYGIQLQYDNASGRNDYLKLVAHTGYTNKIQLTYEMPRLYKFHHWGYGIDIFQRTQKEIGYRTYLNKTLFYRSDKVLLKRQRFESFITYRPDQNRQLRLKAGWQGNYINPFVVRRLNANYFIPNQTQQRFFMIEIYAKMSFLDREVYPTKGFSLASFLRKEGLGIYRDLNVNYLNILWKVYASSTDGKWSVGNVSRVQKLVYPSNKMSEPLPFYNRSFIGYSDDQLRGYELYVMDGPQYFYTKNHIKFRLLHTQLSLYQRGESIFQAFRSIPMELYLIFQVDAGIIQGYNQDNNMLNDRWIIGGGPGLHLVTFNRFVYKLEWSVNHLGEGGLFFHINRKY